MADLLGPEEQIGFARAGEAAGAYVLLAPMQPQRGRPPLWEVVITRLDSGGEDQVFTTDETSTETNDFLDFLDLDLAPSRLVPRLALVLFPGIADQSHPPLDIENPGEPPLEEWWRRVLDRAAPSVDPSLEVVQPQLDSVPESAPAERPERRMWRPLVGVVAAGFAVLVVVGDVAGILYATNNRFLVGAAMGYAAISASVVAVLIGTVAVIRRSGRNWGIAAIVLGIIANPFLLLQVLLFFGGSLG